MSRKTPSREQVAFVIDGFRRNAETIGVGYCSVHADALRKAADMLEALAAENERLRAAYGHLAPVAIELRQQYDEALAAARQLRAMMQRAVMFAGAVGCDEEANDDAAEIVCDGAKLSADTAWLAAPEPQEPPPAPPPGAPEPAPAEEGGQ